MLIRQLAGLKNGLDVTDDDGHVLYKNEMLTLPPKPSYSYAYCSDTAYTESIVAQLHGVSVLYHEATFIEDDKAKAAETLHSTARQAATIAVQAQAGKLLIGHFSARYRDLLPLLQEAKDVFANTELATEGTCFAIDNAV